MKYEKMTYKEKVIFKLECLQAYFSGRLSEANDIESIDYYTSKIRDLLYLREYVKKSPLEDIEEDKTNVISFITKI